MTTQPVPRKFDLKPRDVHCPTCFAVPGEACTTKNSKKAVSPHTARLRLARAAVACPRCSAAQRQPCVDLQGKALPRVHAARLDAAWRARRNGS